MSVARALSGLTYSVCEQGELVRPRRPATGGKPGDKKFWQCSRHWRDYSGDLGAGNAAQMQVKQGQGLCPLDPDGVPPTACRGWR